MTFLQPVYTPFLLWQHHGVDSWDSASYWNMLRLAPPCVLFPLVASVAISQWLGVHLLLFPEWLLWIRFAPCQASAGWTVTGLRPRWQSMMPGITFRYNRSIWHCLMPFEAMAFSYPLKPWFSVQAVLSCTWLILIPPTSSTWAFCWSESHGVWSWLGVLWLLHWRRLLALLVLLLCCWGCTTGLASCLDCFQTLSLGTIVTPFPAAPVQWWLAVCW